MKRVLYCYNGENIFPEENPRICIKALCLCPCAFKDAISLFWTMFTYEKNQGVDHQALRVDFCLYGWKLRDNINRKVFQGRVSRRGSETLPPLFLFELQYWDPPRPPQKEEGGAAAQTHILCRSGRPDAGWHGFTYSQLCMRHSFRRVAAVAWLWLCN